MEKSESIAKLTVALIKAQTEIKVVEKEAENPYFKSKYADLPAIFKEYQRVFLKYGLAVIQVVEGKGLRTTLAHESGEYMSGLAELLLTKQDPQGLGSAITYMRRYALAAVCGIVSSEDDDDGNHASQGHKEPYKATIPHKAPENPAMGKHEPFEAAPMAPKQGLSATGKITSISEPNKGGYVAATLEGYDGPSGKPMRFSTKNAELIAILTESYDGGNKVSIDYNDTVDGKYINHNIENVTVILDSVPF